MLASTSFTSPVANAVAHRRRLTILNATAVPPQFKGVRPIGDRVFVKVDKEEAKTVGGVILPSMAQKKPTAGTVVAAGDTNWLKLGDRVLYSKYAGTELEVKGEEHVLLKEDDVIGILPDNDKIAQLKPLGDRIMIQTSQTAEKSTGGVLLAEGGEKPTVGKVVAVGEGRKKEDSKEVVKPCVEPGQTVMYSKYSGTEFEEDGADYIVVQDGDILAALA